MLRNQEPETPDGEESKMAYVGWVNVNDFGALGDDSTDDTAAIQAAIDSLQVGSTNNFPGTVYFPQAIYRVVASLVIGPGLTLRGEGATEISQEPEIRRKDDTTLPMFVQFDPSKSLSYFKVYNLSFGNSFLAVRTKGNGGDCFRLHNVTNNSYFENILIYNFGGSGFNITRIDPAGVDENALFNCQFNQVFVIGCGEFGWEMTDLCHALWTHCNVNGTVEGFAKWSNPNSTKAGNQEFATFVGCMWEGSVAGASDFGFITDDAQGMPLNLIGMSFSGSSSTACIQMNTTSIANVNCVGCTEFGFTDFMDDNVTPENWSLGDGGSYLRAAKARALTLEGVIAQLEWFNSNGTVDQRLWRISAAIGKLIFTTRLDNGSQDNEWMRVDHNTAVATFKRQFQYGDSSGPTMRSGTGTPEAAVTGAVGDLFLRTDGGAVTTLYIKESGTGNTGWVAK